MSNSERMNPAESSNPFENSKFLVESNLELAVQSGYIRQEHYELLIKVKDYLYAERKEDALHRMRNISEDLKNNTLGIVFSLIEFKNSLNPETDRGIMGIAEELLWYYKSLVKSKKIVE